MEVVMDHIIVQIVHQLFGKFVDTANAEADASQIMEYIYLENSQLFSKLVYEFWLEYSNSLIYSMHTGTIRLKSL